MATAPTLLASTSVTNTCLDCWRGTHTAMRAHGRGAAAVEAERQACEQLRVKSERERAEAQQEAADLGRALGQAVAAGKTLQVRRLRWPTPSFELCGLCGRQH